MKNTIVTLSTVCFALVGFALVSSPAPATAGGHNKIEICHVPPGNTGNFHTISVSPNALAAHLAHGDVEGACSDNCAVLCDDGNACTIDDLGDCEANGCPAPQQVDCNDSNDCTVDWCDPATGCENDAVTDGALCGDGDECRTADMCQDGVCEPGTPIALDHVYFTTDNGVFFWSSDSTDAPAQITNPAMGAYSIAMSPDGDLYVGTGGIDWLEKGNTGAGIFRIDGAGAAHQISSRAAEDLQFDPNGVLHSSDGTGIYSHIGGADAQCSANPTSQFTFESTDVVLTTNGVAHQGIFGRGTHRIDLTSGMTTFVNFDGGEDAHAYDSALSEVCGRSGIFEVLPSGAFSPIVPAAGMGVFNFQRTDHGDYVGNAASYGGLSWPQGLWTREAGSSTFTRQSTHDINALIVDQVCP